MAERATDPVQLARRWVVDYFNRQDAAAARAFITPDYALEIGDVVFAGRDTAWLPAVAKQMETFPGMGMTVHQVLAGTDRVAVCFTEHGASGGPGGRVAVWSGVAIYRSNGTQLTGCVAQEDYLTRLRQLKSGQADPVDPPAAAPWDALALPPDPAAEAAVRRWLMGSWPHPEAAVRCDDEHLTGVPLQFEVTSGKVTELFSSGPEVAFHVVQTGLYRGGMTGVAASTQPMTLHVNGLVRVQDGQVVSGRVIRDRIGLRGALLKGIKP
ncbi:MAG: ester cyclase [Rhodoferax sp.]|nr:ester cyclase [Rhodoferax sp.]